MGERRARDADDGREAVGEDPLGFPWKPQPLRDVLAGPVVDATGKVVDTTTIYPHQPRNDWDGSLHQLAELARKHQVSLIAIGNGTASQIGRAHV